MSLKKKKECKTISLLHMVVTSLRLYAALWTKIL